jgi:hypothetical protein
MDSFSIETGIQAFPSDNELDSMSRTDRISVKRKIKDEIAILVYQALRKARVSPSPTKTRPLFKGPVEAILTVYYSDAKKRDVHNLSIKHALDQLVLKHIIPDDDYTVIPRATIVYGGRRAKPSAVFQLIPIQGGRG